MHASLLRVPYRIGGVLLQFKAPLLLMQKTRDRSAVTEAAATLQASPLQSFASCTRPSRELHATSAFVSAAGSFSTTQTLWGLGSKLELVQAATQARILWPDVSLKMRCIWNLARCDVRIYLRHQTPGLVWASQCLSRASSC